MRKLLMFGCHQMREGIGFSFAFFAAGAIMMLAGLKLIPSVANINHIFTVIGMLLFFFAPLILISTFLLTVIPGLRKYTDDCD
ncbi:MAG: hypothetical protein H7842_11345 [Gammaproteobacteria bacterium SHHR-1]|uniref:hypothetical protein n=1 Tax=Magnetovirga frankeli TaxID=947516 RepID=UPI0012939A7B|nr:hypothetical protein D5125_14410 [gamma proteobacterium SS-5]